MATNHAYIAVAPDRVFAVLDDPALYGAWVVGSDAIRDADPSWPEVGSRFHHRLGVGPLKVNDHTEVLDVDRPHRLVLHAHARPFGSAMVTILVSQRGGGAHVTMIEAAGDPLSWLVINRFTDPLIHVRNAESLRRLKRIAETGSVEA
jgi:uncharacterized protein YndB with AHSA1/START domain